MSADPLERRLLDGVTARLAVLHNQRERRIAEQVIRALTGE